MTEATDNLIVPLCVTARWEEAVCVHKCALVATPYPIPFSPSPPHPLYVEVVLERRHGMNTRDDPAHKKPSVFSNDTQKTHYTSENHHAQTMVCGGAGIATVASWVNIVYTSVRQRLSHPFHHPPRDGL